MITRADSVRDIIEWIEVLDLFDTCIFRGQTHNWPIEASIYRPIKTVRSVDFEKGYDEQVYKEEQIIDLFKKRAKPHLNYEPDNKLEWMAIAQHHAIPTRLLDWTFSVLIAAYFACQDMGSGDSDRQAVIYALGQLKHIKNSKVNPYEVMPKDQIFVFEPPHIHPRITAQQSCLTIQNHEFGFSNIHKLYINKSREGDIKVQLNELGINAYTMSPDLAGLGESIKWQYKWGRFRFPPEK